MKEGNIYHLEFLQVIVIIPINEINNLYTLKKILLLKNSSNRHHIKNVVGVQQLDWHDVNTESGAREPFLIWVLVKYANTHEHLSGRDSPYFHIPIDRAH